MARRLILDAGAVLAFTRGDRRVASLFKAAQEAASETAVPPVVVTQCVRGGRRDAAVLRLLHSVHVPFVGARLARAAGELLGASGMSDAADAQVVAEAMRAGPATIVTGDPDDLTLLAGEKAGRGITIVAI